MQDASVHRSWLGIDSVDVSTAGGREGNLRIEPLRAEDARRFAQTIIAQAKLVGGAGASRASNDAITADLVRLLQRGGVI